MTTHHAWNDSLDRHLVGLLTGGDADLDAGAELEVTHTDGQVAFAAPLARHHRVEHPNLVWIRPVLGGDTTEAGGYVFDLSLARRCALEFTTVQVAAQELRLDLVNGQRATIRPAGEESLAELTRWDTYCYTALDAQTEAELDALAHDA